MSGYGNYWSNSSDVIINEIKAKVLARDFELYGIKRRNIPPLGIDYLEVLDGVTKLDRLEIEHIAKEVIATHKRGPTPPLSPQQQLQARQKDIWQHQEHRSFSVFLKDFTKGFSIYKLLIISSLLILFAVTVHILTNGLKAKQVNKKLEIEIQQRMSEQEKHKASILENMQKQIAAQTKTIKLNSEQAALKSLFQSLNRQVLSARRDVDRFYYQNHRFPESNKEASSMLNRLKSEIGVRDAFISSQKGIVLVLDSQFESGTVIHHKPSQFGQGIQWRCETNAVKAFLENPTQHICNHNPSIRRMTLIPEVWAD
ncbi:hypothetical protein [Shewanella japonica]|uniref:Uncharacterized protein n=1 Tax=Shewanella japonica TaxID=93973 RepID=A0ABM6JR24_9GAMM|nr:hypothetical protein [Shewanella japonica]ARD24147.1 hypothetical protein SJ2017_3918 [Shewanella japonica]